MLYLRDVVLAYLVSEKNGRFFLTVAGPYKRSRKLREFRSGYEMDR